MSHRLSLNVRKLIRNGNKYNSPDASPIEKSFRKGAVKHVGHIQETEGYLLWMGQKQPGYLNF